MSRQRAGAREVEEQFSDFARARTPHLYRSAWLLCGDRAQAEDLVQETLAKVFVKWRRIDNPAAYAQTTLTRTFLSAKRRRSSGEQPWGEVPEAPDPATSSATDRVVLQVALLAALAELAPADRAVVVLRYLDDLAVDEVAERMGTTSGAVRNRSMRALARLRPLLDPSLTVTPERGITP
ncbi:SigE family RNA polymerase sigma factor [Nocardioides sp. R-C-SC26]|uniref:SigE family RNA polymerase sigma factor n=1 Tax=Nocardioides sp. R-C-SC26 TaxID=2870414 RepID=UPI001E30D7ED|nr:SigE family RNA polymerase sigma factor [Nocardioides sp. R-C-SC26]